MSEWSTMRSRVRELENLIDSSLRQYSYDSRNDFFEAQINDTFQQVEELLGEMDKIVSEERENSAKLYHLDRHRATLLENKQEWNKIKKNIAEARDRQELLSSVRQITAERLHNSNYLLDNERERLDNSHSLTDDLLARAYATKESLFSQRASLVNIKRQMADTVQSVPGINYLLRQIDRRKTREKMMLAALISLCIVIFFYFR